MTGDAALECRVGLGRPGDEVPRRRVLLLAVGEFSARDSRGDFCGAPLQNWQGVG